MFTVAFSLIGLKMFVLASYVPSHLSKVGKINVLDDYRSKIIDRNGMVLATNIKTYSLYVHPHELIDKQDVAISLSKIFPSLSVDNTIKKFSDGRKFIWIKKRFNAFAEVIGVELDISDIQENGLVSVRAVNTTRLVSK